jgi:hypothetical protein
MAIAYKYAGEGKAERRTRLTFASTHSAVNVTARLTVRACLDSALQIHASPTTPLDRVGCGMHESAQDSTHRLDRSMRVIRSDLRQRHWQPLSEASQPPQAYSAMFSTIPYSGCRACTMEWANMWHCLEKHDIGIEGRSSQWRTPNTIDRWLLYSHHLRQP